MRVVIDAVPMRGGSLGLVVEHMLEGWLQLDSGDDLHLVVGPDPQATLPDGVIVHQMKFGRRALLSRLHAQSVLIPRLCRSLDADILLGMVPTTAITPLPCPRAIVIYSARTKLRPEGLTRKSRLLPTLGDRLAFRQFDAAVCISERTKADLLHLYPRLWKRPLRTAHLGADHVDDWPITRPKTPYAIALCDDADANPDLLVDAWALRRQQGESTLPLALVGVTHAERPRLLGRIAERGLVGDVNLLTTMTVETFRETFASSSLVVLPSGLDGFGLRVAEAMRLRIPAVIAPDLALLEVADGHATVMEGNTPEALARAVAVAQRATPESLEAARRHAERFTWSNFAFGIRWMLAETVAGVAAPARPPRRLAPQALPAHAGATAGVRTTTSRSLVPAFFRRGPAIRPRGSLRWLGATVVGTLAVSGISAASIALVNANKAPAGPATTTTSVTSSSHGGSRSGNGFVQLPAPSTSSTSSTPSSGSTATTSIAGTTSSTAPRRTSSTAVPPVTVPRVTVPPVTIPTITIPPLPLGPLPCAVGSTLQTSPVSLPLQPCSIATPVKICRCA